MSTVGRLQTTIIALGFGALLFLAVLAWGQCQRPRGPIAKPSPPERVVEPFEGPLHSLTMYWVKFNATTADGRAADVNKVALRDTNENVTLEALPSTNEAWSVALTAQLGYQVEVEDVAAVAVPESGLVNFEVPLDLIDPAAPSTRFLQELYECSFAKDADSNINVKCYNTARVKENEGTVHVLTGITNRTKTEPGRLISTGAMTHTKGVMGVFLFLFPTPTDAKP